MKKILLILIAFTSFASFAQAEFPEGIALSGNASSANTSKVVIQEPTTGNLNYINALDLPASTADKLKGFLSTGLIKNGLISANGDPTKFNITAGIGIISNFDDPENPISTIINFPAFNSITPTYLTTGNITYVAINSTPAVVMQATPFTPEQRRSLIILGATIHSNLTTINVLNNISAPTNADTNQLHDFMEAVGALNITGNKYTANGANLQLNKSAGVLFKLGSNFAVDWKNPHEIAQAGGTAVSFRYRTQNGTESADMTSISPGLYDLNNVLTTVPNNKFTIQTVTVFQTGLTRIQWGQNIYADLQAAKNALLTRDFAVENNIKENGVTRAYIIVRNSTTSLQNVSDAYISEAQKFGGVASGGVALTLANIVTALGYTPENEANKQNSLAVDGTNLKYPTVTAVNAGLATKQNTLTNPITGTGTADYLPKWSGTNTQINSLFRDNGSKVSVFVSPAANVSFNMGNNISGATQSSGFRVGSNIQSDVTSSANVNETFVSTVASSFTLQNLNLYFASKALFGAGSTVVNLTGFRASNAILGATNNFGFMGDVGAGANNWNIYMGGTAKNYFNGNSLFGTTVDNATDKVQISGTISHSAGTLANQGVIKSQLDLKADLASPTFTGVPNVPTATAGTNTTQIASTAFATALDANNVKLTGGQTITGSKTFTNSSIGAGIYVNNTSTGRGISTTNSINGVGISSNNASNGIAILSYNEGAGNGIVSATTTEGTGFNYVGQNQSTTTFSVDKFGNIIGNNFNGSASLTGTPTAPTATAGTNTTQIASTAFVLANAGGTPQDLQSVINTGGYAELDGGNSYAEILRGDAGERYTQFGIGNSSLSIDSFNLGFSNSNSINTKETGLNLQEGNLSFFQKNITNDAETNLILIDPTANTTLNFPAKTVTGTYIINTTPTIIYTVSTLPTGVLNDMAIVSDATAPTYLSTLIGGGSVVTPVWHNGTNWVAH